MWAPSAGAGRRDLLLILLLAVAPLIAYAPAWLEGRLLAPGDGAALHLPLRTEVWRAWGRGEIPSWNASVFSGAPLLASYRPGALHPLTVALTPFAPFRAFQWLVLSSLALAGPPTPFVRYGESPAWAAVVLSFGLVAARRARLPRPMRTPEVRLLTSVRPNPMP